VKLDRRFMEGIVDDAAARAVVAAVLQLVHALGLVAVCEGVETPEQLAVVRDLGCDAVQGYVVAPAMLADEVAEFVASRRP
jgi:EAL domain-containing protein (putative c-di-GMP-specific phosphodiesterase class I)